MAEAAYIEPHGEQLKEDRLLSLLLSCHKMYVVRVLQCLPQDGRLD